MANTAKDVLNYAKKYVGTTNGDQFVDYYNKLTGIGLPHGVFWCACFVSSIMDMAKVPQDSVKAYKGCATGVTWFKSKGRFKTRQSGYVPKAGDIIFFEWQPWNEGTPFDDGADHTGIVESVSGGYVYTIEGNSGNNGVCKRNTYSLSYNCIEGYGIPLYNVNTTTPTASTTTSTTNDNTTGDITYQAYDTKWLPNVVNDKTYAGRNKSISGIYISAKNCDVYYRAGEMGKSGYLPEVKNRKDYAGNLGKPIDRLQIRVDKGYVDCQVKTAKSGWLPTVRFGKSYVSGNDGFCGIVGEPIIAVRMK